MAAPVSLRSPQGLFALDRTFGHPAVTVQLAGRWASWDELAAAELTELAKVTGGRALRVAADCPPLPMLPPGCRAVGRFDDVYPAAFSQLQNVPNVAFITGRLPDGPAVTVAGGMHPTAAGFQLARRTAELAVSHRAAVVIVLTTAVGDAALDAALVAGGQVVAVVPFGVNRLQATNRRLVDEVLGHGGAIVSAVDADRPGTAASVFAAGRMAVALGRCVLLAEAGLEPHGGLASAYAAWELGRYLIVPEQHDPRAAALSALGSVALARTDPVAQFAASEPANERLSAGLAPADAVVTCDADLDAAVAYGSGVSDVPPPARDASGWIELG